MEGPQGLRDLLPVDADSVGQVGDLPSDEVLELVNLLLVLGVLLGVSVIEEGLEGANGPGRREARVEAGQPANRRWMRSRGERTRVDR